MPKDMRTDYEPFKGQGVTTRHPDGRLIHGQRKPHLPPTQDKGSLYPYMPKLTQFLFDLPKIQANPFERITSVYGAEYGSYIELGAVGDPDFNVDAGTSIGANIPNRGFTDACMVYDRIKYTANYLHTNMYQHYAYIDQKYPRKGITRNAGEATQLAAAITGTMAQEASIQRKAVMTRLFCDCLDGVSGKMTDGTFKSGKNTANSTPITEDSFEIKGWAGKEIYNKELIIDKLDVSVNNGQCDPIDTEVALQLAKDIRSTLTYGGFLGNYFVPGHVRLDAFTNPVLVMESAVKEALDDAFLNANIASGGSNNPLSFNKTWTEYVKDGKNVSILTTDMFEDLPLQKSGDEIVENSKKLICAIVEPDMFKNFIYQDDMWPFPCSQPRGMVYDYQRVEALGVDVRRPSVVFTGALPEEDGALPKED